MTEIPQIAVKKNQWLAAQVDVEFPTEPSLKGLALYQEFIQGCRYQTITPQAVHQDQLADVYLVDFHRLTIMFALMQTEKYTIQSEKELIIEFFTQIIFSPPCQLYLAFEAGQAVAAGIVTKTDDELLVSDIVISENSRYCSGIDFANVLIEKNRDEKSGKEVSMYYLEADG